MKKIYPTERGVCWSYLYQNQERRVKERNSAVEKLIQEGKQAHFVNESGKKHLQDIFSR